MVEILTRAGGLPILSGVNPRSLRAYVAFVSVALAVVVAFPAGGAGASAPAPVVGASLAAPVVEAPIGSIRQYSWDRCRRYVALATADGALTLWRAAAAGQMTDAVTGAVLPNTGRVTGVAGPLVGESEAAARLDGARSAITSPHLFALDGLGAYTFELWVRPRSVDGHARFLLAQESLTSGVRDGSGLWLSSAGLGFERWGGGARTGIVYPAGLPLNAWAHVAATFDGTTLRLFVNGRQVGSRVSTAATDSSTTALVAGARSDGQQGLTGFLAADVADVAAYGTALPRSHIAAHAEAGSQSPCVPIVDAAAATYIPVTDDIGDSVRATTTVLDGSGRLIATTSSETAQPITDGAGATVSAAIAAPAAGATVDGTVQLTGALGGAPADRVEFVVDGVVRYAKVGEPPYQYTWYTRAETNGAHTLAVRAYSPHGGPVATAQITVTVSNKTLFPAPLAFGPESMYSEFNQGDSASANAAAVANNLLDDVWPARGLPLVKLGWPLTWNEDPYGDAFWRFYQYSLRPTSSLLYMWETTRDRRYLAKLLAILRSYATYDQSRPVNTLTFDNNHAAAYRAMVLVNTYVKLRADGELPADLDSALRASLAKLGAFLTDPKHFEGGVNHGFNEGAALLLIADNFPEMPSAATWRQTAIDRLSGMLASTLDSDGVEVENSPFYHVYVLGLVFQIAEWAKRYEPALASSYSAAEQHMLRYAAEVTQPSGYLPMLGATATTYLPSQDPSIYGPMAASDPEFAFAYTHGAQGTAPPDGAALFPSSGLFVLRSALGAASNLPQQTYMTFDAGPYRTEHSDLDALGVTMYAAGQTLLPESGLFTYTQQPERGYFHGTGAHNTIVVDGADQAQGDAHPGPYGNAGPSSWATGTSDLYSGVHHRRAVVVLRQGLSLVVDQLRSAATHSYTQTWHLDPSAVLDTSGQDAFVSSPAGQRLLTIRQADPAGETLTAVKGQTNPTLAGWYSKAYGAKSPSYQLSFTRKASTAQFATLLAAGPYANQASTITDHGVNGGTEFDVCVSGTVGYTVTVPADETAQVSVTGGACPAAIAPTSAPDPARAALPAPDLTQSTADQQAFTTLSARSGAIPVLLFHSVCETACTSYNATPEEFARILLMLRSAGYQTISIGDYVRFEQGQPVSLPSRPVLITFDDGRLDAFRGADQILAGLGDQATMFDITANTEARDPHYLRWEELASMDASGRWQVQLHAGQGHVDIPTGAATNGPFYGWRRYDPVRYPTGDHLEPYADWQTRAEGDVAQGEALLAAHLPAHQPLAFAVPFGDYGQYHTNDSRIPGEFSAFLHSRYGVFFVQPHPDPDFTTPGHEADRYTIRSTTTADTVYQWLTEHA